MEIDFCKIRQNSILFFAKVLCSKPKIYSLMFISWKKKILFSWLSSVFEKNFEKIFDLIPRLVYQYHIDQYLRIFCFFKFKFAKCISIISWR